jgi:hypothetical protein
LSIDGGPKFLYKSSRIYRVSQIVFRKSGTIWLFSRENQQAKMRSWSGFMTCAERQQLFERYYDQVSVCFELLEKHARWGWLFDHEGGANEAFEAAVYARITLEQHEREHGCGELGFLVQAGDRTAKAYPENDENGSTRKGIDRADQAIAMRSSARRAPPPNRIPHQRSV